MAEASDAQPLVRLETDDQVATITLDSPSNRNALSRRLVGELTGCLAEAEADDAARVVVLTHTGGTFCAGADLSEALEFGMVEGTRNLVGLLRQIVALDKPVVAVADGHVRAGGVGLIGACDLALVSDSSTLAFSEALLGLAPAIISLTTRSRMAERDAARLYLGGATFDGTTAAAVGLATRSVPSDALASGLVSLLAELRKASPQGLRETKRLLNGAMLERIDRDGPELVALSERLFASDEAREGMLAFRERRLPRWAQPPA